jgi:ankyrin repeat protein
MNKQQIGELYARALLSAALNWGQLDVPGRVRAAVEAGADLNDPNFLSSSGKPPLLRAINKHDPETVAAMLQGGADPRIPANWNWSLEPGELMGAAGPNLLRCAIGEADDGAKLDRPWAEQAAKVEALMRERAQELAMLSTLGYGPASRLEVFLNEGVDPNAKTLEGVPAVHVAIVADQGTSPHESNAKLSLLIAHGADVNAVDAQRRTPLHRAAELGSLELQSCGLICSDEEREVAIHQRAVGGLEN